MPPTTTVKRDRGVTEKRKLQIGGGLAYAGNEVVVGLGEEGVLAGPVVFELLLLELLGGQRRQPACVGNDADEKNGGRDKAGADRLDRGRRRAEGDPSRRHGRGAS